MGVDFTMVEGKGPKILNTIRSSHDVNNVKILGDPVSQLPFIGQTLKVHCTALIAVTAHSIVIAVILCVSLCYYITDTAARDQRQDRPDRVHWGALDAGCILGRGQPD